MSMAERTRTISWLQARDEDASHRYVVCRHHFIGPDPRLHYGFDGWQEPIRDTPLQQVGPGLWVAEVQDLEGHVALDCATTDGEFWNNNSGLDYRLWIDLEVVDSHLHVSGPGPGPLGIGSYITAADSAGIHRGVVSWPEHRSLDRLDLSKAGLAPLVWVRPGDTRRADLRLRLASGSVGIKLHPTGDDYRADDPALDPYIDIAAEMGHPVACHSAPGDSDPDHIRRLAERFPTVPVILYHTYLGPLEGRRRAVRHALEQPNLYLETSWCGWRQVMWMVEQVGEHRVMFGSDAMADGSSHYNRNPPNVEGAETYSAGMVALVGELGPRAAEMVMGGNARRLFGLDRDRRLSAAPSPYSDSR